MYTPRPQLIPRSVQTVKLQFDHHLCFRRQLSSSKVVSPRPLLLIGRRGAAGIRGCLVLIVLFGALVVPVAAALDGDPFYQYQHIMATSLGRLSSRLVARILVTSRDAGVVQRGASSSFRYAPTTAAFLVPPSRSIVGGDGASGRRRRRDVESATTTCRYMGSSPRKRKHKDEVVSPSSSRTSATTASSPLDVLEWDRFEFGDSPKWDARFGGDSSLTALAANEESLDRVAVEEAQRDEEMSVRLDREVAAWQNLDPDLVQRATKALTPLVKPERLDKIRSVLQRRTSNVRFLYENPSNPSNVWACLRTIDSFGIQHVDVIVQSGKYKGKAAITQKRGMRTALGSARWLTIRNHLSTSDAIQFIRQQRGEGKPGFRIYASDVNPTARDIRSIDWNSDDTSGGGGGSGGGGPICIVMGNEETGISDEMRQLVDGTFYLPMSGFAESFNLSVATAVTLAYLNAASSNGPIDVDRTSHGPIRPGDLPQQELDCLILKGMLNSVANRKASEAYLKREGIILPEEIRLL